jgi:hypothetical protein
MVSLRTGRCCGPNGDALRVAGLAGPIRRVHLRGAALVGIPRQKFLQRVFRIEANRVGVALQERAAEDAARPVRDAIVFKVAQQRD